MTSHDEQRLSDALRRQAEHQDPTLLTLDDVTSRARGIRRRRVATTVVAAAAVAAVIVPTGIIAADRGTDSNPPVATNTPAPTPTEGTDAPEPTESVDATDQHLNVRVVGDLPTGYAPRIAVRVGDEVITPTGQRVKVGADAVYVAYVGGSVVTVERIGEEESMFRVRSTLGKVSFEAPAKVDGALAVTPDRTAAAYVALDGRIHTWTASDGDREMSGPVDNIRLGSMTGSQTCGATAADECVVVFSRGEGGAGWASSTGASEELPGFLGIDDASDRAYAGQTKSTLDGSCSEVRRIEGGAAAVETCDFTLGSFSPDGVYIVGGPAYLDGLCCAKYDVLDAANLKSLLTLDARGGNEMSYIAEVGWEDDSHLLATVFDGQAWRVVRVALDGSAELADAGEMPTSDLGELPLRIDVGA